MQQSPFELVNFSNTTQALVYTLQSLKINLLKNFQFEIMYLYKVYTK